MSEQVVEAVHVSGGVVVGDDGSPASREAMVWAADEARCRQTTLHVVKAWAMTHVPRPASWSPGYVPSLLEFEASCREYEERRIKEILGNQQGIELHVVHAPAAKALIQASEGADLVVVGSRGRGGFQELVLGSVAEQCVRHCHCPVVVVRPRRGRKR